MDHQELCILILQRMTQQFHEADYACALRVGLDWDEIRALEALTLLDFHVLTTLSPHFIRIDGFAGAHACTLTGPLVLWHGVSEAGIAALDQRHAQGRIAFGAGRPLVYLIDGQMLRLPIAKRRHHAYKRPHWYPVTLSTPAQVTAHIAPLRQSRRTRRAPDHAPQVI